MRGGCVPPMNHDLNFPYRKATPISIKMRRPIKGVGINDAEYNVCAWVDGKYKHCPIYQSWVNMIERSFCPKYKEKYPTYIDVTCCDDWLNFSSFREWMITNKWQKNSLDKDICVKGNKVYAPELCIFVPMYINNAFSDKSRKDSIPSGVEVSRHGTYRARLSVKGKYMSFGSYKNISDAIDAHQKEKNNYLMSLVDEYSDQMDMRAIDAIVSRIGSGDF